MIRKRAGSAGQPKQFQERKIPLNSILAVLPHPSKKQHHSCYGSVEKFTVQSRDYEAYRSSEQVRATHKRKLLESRIIIRVLMSEIWHRCHEKIGWYREWNRHLLITVPASVLTLWDRWLRRWFETPGMGSPIAFLVSVSPSVHV